MHIILYSQKPGTFVLRVVRTRSQHKQHFISLFLCPALVRWLVPGQRKTLINIFRKNTNLFLLSASLLLVKLCSLHWLQALCIISSIQVRPEQKVLPLKRAFGRCATFSSTIYLYSQHLHSYFV